MNPEFRRNLWLELTPPKLVLALALPGILLLAAWLRPDGDLAFVNNFSIFLFYLVAVIWGTRRAANTVGSEVRGRTWESQVMSAIGAWSMTWGKLAGGCILVWLASLVCLGSSLAVEAQLFPWDVALGNAGLRLCIAFAAQAVALCSALIILRKSAPGKSLNSTLSQAVGIIASIIFGIAFAPTRTQYDWAFTLLEQQAAADFVVGWYELDARANTFRLVSLAVFVGWTWLAANRLMRHVLQYSSLPWAWVAFVLFMIVYFAGFFTGEGSSAAILIAAGFVMTAWLVYPAALSDVKDAIGYGWLFRDLRAGRWRSALTRMPAWMPTMLILAVFAVAVALTSPFSIGEELGQRDVEAFWDRVSAGQWMSVSWMLAIVLFVIRDLAIIHFFAFSDAGRYSDVVALLVLFVLYLLIPIAGSAAGNATVVAAFFPLDLGNPAQTLLPVAVEALLATIGAFLMARRAARPPKRQPAPAASTA